MVACRPTSGVKEIYCYEVPNFSTGFNPQLYVDTSEFATRKVDMFWENFKEEMRPHPHPRSLGGIWSIERYRGSQVGLNYAEAFEVMRIIK